MAFWPPRQWKRPLSTASFTPTPSSSSWIQADLRTTTQRPKRACETIWTHNKLFTGWRCLFSLPSTHQALLPRKFNSNVGGTGAWTLGIKQWWHSESSVLRYWTPPFRAVLVKIKRCGRGSGTALHIPHCRKQASRLHQPTSLAISLSFSFMKKVIESPGSSLATGKRHKDQN